MPIYILNVYEHVSTRYYNKLINNFLGSKKNDKTTFYFPEDCL